MNLSSKEAAILEQLVVAGSAELYGLQMVKASGDRLKLGTIYVTLNRLEDKGYVTSRKEVDAQQTVPRRLYRISGAGARAFHVYMAGMTAMANATELQGAA